MEENNDFSLGTENDHGFVPEKPEIMAVETFQFFNCAQSVFLPFALARGWSREEALKVAAGFGGGMGRLQETCGALSGGFMALGLDTGQTREGDAESKNLTYSRIRLLASRFSDTHRSRCCRDLLGVDLQSEDGQRAFSQENMHTRLCSRFVSDAAVWTREILQS